MRIAWIVAAGAAAGIPAAALPVADPAAEAASLPPSDGLDVPGARLPILKDRRYVMSGAARPLLFWIGRDDIGLARIVWRRSPDGARGYELLVGTDPARAPRGLNRWGFITEEALDGSGGVLALMNGSHETSYDEEAAETDRANRGSDFRAISSRTAPGTTEWRLARVRAPETLTVHEAAGAVDLLNRNHRPPPRRRDIGPDVRPGFLIAVADLVEATVAGAGQGGAPAGVRYVFGEQVYELRVRAVDPVRLTVAGRSLPALDTWFETRALATGRRTRFRLTIGTEGEAAAVPLAIEWQPRWWLRVSLRLADPPAPR